MSSKDCSLSMESFFLPVGILEGVRHFQICFAIAFLLYRMNAATLS